MTRIPSSVFRRVYPHLDAPTEVTVSGHVIGTWIPAPYVAREPISLEQAAADDPAVAIAAGHGKAELPIVAPFAPAAPVRKPRETPRERQRRIDEILRKANG